MCQPACMPRLHSLTIIHSISHRPRTTMRIHQHLPPSQFRLLLQSGSEVVARTMAMALVLRHALLLASAAAAAAAMDNATGDASPVLCNGAECEPPGKPLPIYYGYPPPAPSLPSAPPAPPTPSAPGSQTPCPPVGVVCCGGAGGQYMPQQPNYYGPPAGGYVPYYNASASPPALLLAPITLVGYYAMAACIFLPWLVV